MRAPLKPRRVFLKTDELQKLVLEQMELRKKLERDFQSLKGSAAPSPAHGAGAGPAPGAVLTPGPTDNFQDQMKRELAYREEMVQQLQIVRGKAQPISILIF